MLKIKHSPFFQTYYQGSPCRRKLLLVGLVAVVGLRTALRALLAAEACTAGVEAGITGIEA